MQYDLVIHNGTIVTVNPGFEILPSGMICIREGRIQRVERGAPDTPIPAAGEVIDAQGGIVLPGLVNTHTHLPMTLFRGLADDLPLMEWLNDHIFPAEAKFIRTDTVRWGSLLGGVEMLLSGTTTCCDGYFFEDEVAQAVESVGMRGVLAQGVIDFPAPGAPDPKENVSHAVGYVKRWRDRSARIRPSIFCHSPYTCGEDTLKRAKDAADENGVLFQIHVAETKAERERMIAERRVTPVGYLERLGILDENTLLVHAVWVDPDDIARIADRGAKIAHSPGSSMKLGAGVAPVTAFLSKGVRVGLGTDGCASNNNLDLFQEMNLAAMLHKVHTLDPTALDAQTVLCMATLEGAAAIGLDHDIGSIEVGKLADLIVLDTRKPHLVPLYHPVSHLVYTVGGADVRDVIVAGSVVVRNRRVLTVDVEKIMDAVVRIGRAIRAG